MTSTLTHGIDDRTVPTLTGLAAVGFSSAGPRQGSRPPDGVRGQPGRLTHLRGAPLLSPAE
jgi:hypothetical protein